MSAYEFTLYSSSQIIAGILALVVAVFLYQFRKSPGAKHLSFMELGIAIWGITQGMEVAAISVPDTLLWSKLSYLGISFTPLCYFLFAISYSQHKELLNTRWIYALLIIPVMTLMVVFTNEHHHLHWESITIEKNTTLGHYTYGPWFWIFYTYTYTLMIFGFTSIYWAVFKFPKHYKPQVISLLIGTALPMICNWVYVFDINPIPGYDWTPIAFCLSGILIAVGVVRLRIFKLIPFARNLMVDNMEEGVLVVDSTRTIVDSNHAIFNMFGKDQYIGSPFQEKFPEFYSLVNDKFSNKVHHKEIELIRDEKSKFFDVTISEFKRKRRFFSGYLIILHDETDRVNAERALRKANINLKAQIKLKESLIADLDAFSHMVAHDLKNMLGVIVSSSEAIEYNLQNNYQDDIPAYNKIIGQSAQKTISITRELLLLASIRKEEIKMSDINMSDILKEVMLRLEPMIAQTGAKIDIPNDWPLVTGHFAWIEEVWFNYIHNALKYGGTPPIIKVGYEMQSDNMVRFTVTDNGNGLSEEDLKKLFKQFSRLNGIQVKGHGLGLSIVKRIVEKLGGEVNVVSENREGRGCVFSFSLQAMVPEKSSHKTKHLV